MWWWREIVFMVLILFSIVTTIYIYVVFFRGSVSHTNKNIFQLTAVPSKPS